MGHVEEAKATAGICLLGAVNNAVCDREEHKQPVYSLKELQKKLFLYRQVPHQSNEDYTEAFEELWDTFKGQGGCTW